MKLLTDSEKESEYSKIVDAFIESLPQLESKEDMFDFVIHKLSALPHFEWTGIYEYDTPKEMLTLYPMYVGLPTGHIKIPKGKGVCGTAVANNDDIIIDDVTKQENYLACSVGTRSEIVVLIKKDNQILGQIDVDCDEPGAFNDMDRKNLKKIAELLAEYIPK